MEIQRIVLTPNGFVPTKRDQWGADLIYASEIGFVLVQTKGGLTPTKTLVRAAERAFAKADLPRYNYKFQHVHIWRPRARRPEVIEVWPCL